jgi:hypothetical protein
MTEMEKLAYAFHRGWIKNWFEYLRLCRESKEEK